MIVTVTCNPAVDVTYRIGRFSIGEVHRVEEVHARPGGKGVNVARVLTQIGAAAVATGFADDRFDALLESFGVQAAFVVSVPTVRRTVVVHADESTTSLWEPGPAVVQPEKATAALERRVASFLADATALVVSGSLPPGVEPTFPSRLASSAGAAGVPVVLDLDTEALRAAAAGSGAVLTPNLDELGRLVRHGRGLDVVAAARDVSSRSGAPVVVTLGSEGMIAVSAGTAWHASLGVDLEGNPTGAGDAAAAAIALGLGHGTPWQETLADAVALSAAAVLAPVAGEVDIEAFRRWRADVVVRQVGSYISRRR